MTFKDPGRFALLVVVGALALAYLVAQLRRPRYAVRFTNLELLASVVPKRPRWRRHVPAAAMSLALVALVFALAHPVATDEVPIERSVVVLALDVSLSMQATDVDPTRLQAAQQAALGFVKKAPKDIELGLVTFAGTAHVVVPPTKDRQPIQRAIDGLQLAEGTAIGEAIFASLDALKSEGIIASDPTSSTIPNGGDGGTGTTGTNGSGPNAPSTDSPPARIVVMSDGETVVGRPNEDAAKAASDANVPVWTVAFGTPTGTVVINGQVDAVPVNPQALKAISDSTGGKSFSASSSDQLERVFQGVAATVEHKTVQHDRSPWFVGAALLLACLAGAGSILWSQRLP